ncbi:hypothetical protein ACNPHD_17915 [Klebsiella pneumoniae]
MKKTLVGLLLLVPAAAFAECTTVGEYTSCMYIDGNHVRQVTTGPGGQRIEQNTRINSDGSIDGYTTGDLGDHTTSIRRLPDGNTMIKTDGKTQICNELKCY